MAQEHSFDIVSRPDKVELDNSIHQAQKEIATRFDLKDSGSEIQPDKETITTISADEFKLKSVVDVLQNKLVKRGVSLKFFEFGEPEDAASGTKRQVIKIKQGISADKGREINKFIKETKAKVNSQIQGDELRVFSKSIDELQVIMQKIKANDFGIELQFVNYR